MSDPPASTGQRDESRHRLWTGNHNLRGRARAGHRRARAARVNRGARRTGVVYDRRATLRVALLPAADGPVDAPAEGIALPLINGANTPAPCHATQETCNHYNPQNPHPPTSFRGLFAPFLKAPRQPYTLTSVKQTVVMRFARIAAGLMESGIVSSEVVKHFGATSSPTSKRNPCWIVDKFAAKR